MTSAQTQQGYLGPLVTSLQLQVCEAHSHGDHRKILDKYSLTAIMFQSRPYCVGTPLSGSSKTQLLLFKGSGLALNMHSPI